MRYQKWLVVAVATVFAQGCATITRGTSEAWTVESDPIGAQVTLSSGERCITPCTLKKKRKDPFGVTVEKAGYSTVRAQVLSQTSNAGSMGMAGNVLIGGLIGIGVDASSGATKDLKPNPLVIRMEPEGAQPLQSTDEPDGAALEDSAQ